MYNLKKKIYKLTQKYNKFLIGYSGGLDSTVLLHLLNKFKKNIKLRAIHINHNTSILSSIFEKHCILTCLKLNINLIIKKIINKNNNYNEQQLRNKRYFIYNKYLKKNEILLTAHHKNDQCETILLSLKRGCGLKGLIGIKKKNYLNKKKIIRPFLKITKKQLKKYALIKKIKWIEDISNNNINHDRNFLRNIILPLINIKWPFFISSIIRNSNICNKQYKLLKYLMKKKFKNSLINKKQLNLNYMLTLKKEENIFILRKWLNKYFISYKLINLILNKILIYKKKNYLQLHLKNFFLYKYNNILYLDKKLYEIKKKKLEWKINKKKFTLPQKLGFLYKDKNNSNKLNLIRKPNKTEKIYIKFQPTGKIEILGKKKQKIKNIWQKFKILPWKRKFIPFIYYNNKLISCPNYFITKYGNPKNLPSWCINFKKKK